MNKKFLLSLPLVLILLALCLYGCNKEQNNVNTDTTAEPVITAEPRSIQEETIMADSILYASEMANGIQGYYEDADRTSFIITNKNSTYRVGLSGDGLMGLNEIRNADGKVLLSGGMTAFAQKTDGSLFYTTEHSCRMNTSRMGYYYYEMNIRGLEFTAEGKMNTVYDETNTKTLKPSSGSGNDVSNLKFTGTAISGKISSVTDPYVIFEPNVSGKGYNAIVLDITYVGQCTNAELFYFTSKSTNSYFSQDESIIFTMSSSDKKQTIVIPFMEEGYDTNYVLKGLRFDFNSSLKKGDTFKIENIRLAYVDNSGSSISCGIEHTLHSYSDKVNSDLRIIFDKAVSDVSKFGYRYTIPQDTVESLQIGTSSGVVTDISAVSGNIEYIGFNIKNAGILGFILQNDGISNANIYWKDGNYVLEIYINVVGEHKKDSSVDFGHRIYTSNDSDFEKLATEARIERNPLTFTVTEKFYSSALRFSEYDTTTGSYVFNLSGTDFSSAYKKNQNKYYGGTISVTGDDLDRKIYICARSSSGCLEKAVLLDESKLLLPIDTMVCKNFQGEYEEPYYDPKDIAYGDTIYPLVIKAGETVTHTMLNLYQRWGVNNIKQLSSIAFHIGYYHLSTGTTESNCIAPYFVYGRDGWTLPDFRGCSGIMWSNQPQFNSVGRLRFLSYNKDGNTYYSEYTSAEIKSSGPVYAEIDYSYKSYDGSFAYTLTHTEFPSTDENRTYYTMTVDVLQDVTISDVKNDFTLFNFDGRFGYFTNTAYLGADGNVVELTNSPSDKLKVYTLSKGSTYATFYNTTSTDIENFAFIVKDYDFTIGGKKWDGNLVFRNSSFEEGMDLNFMEISLNEGKVKFKKGDKLVMHFVLLPYGVANQTDYDNVKYVYEDSVLNPWRITNVSKGTLVESDYLARVLCDNNEAEFTVTGSRDCSAVRVDGFTNLTRPKIQELIDGNWVDYVYNVEEYDGYQVNYTSDGFFSYSFIVKMEDYNSQRTFRIYTEE